MKTKEIHEKIAVLYPLSYMWGGCREELCHAIRWPAPAIERISIPISIQRKSGLNAVHPLSSWKVVLLLATNTIDQKLQICGGSDFVLGDVSRKPKPESCSQLLTGRIHVGHQYRDNDAIGRGDFVAQLQRPPSTLRKSAHQYCRIQGNEAGDKKDAQLAWSLPHRSTHT